MARRLILLFAALLTLLGAGPANALAGVFADPASGAQNCARASSSAAPTHAQADRPGSPCTRLGSDAGSASTALGCCVATKGARGGPNLLVEAAEQGGKGELTGAGHALAKHGGREGSAFPTATGSSAVVNAQGSAIVRDIVENEFRRVSFYNRRLKFQVTDIYDKSGRGVRYSRDGDFVGFLEPRR